MSIYELRQGYHRRICQQIIQKRRKEYDRKERRVVEYPNFADVGSKASVDIAWGIVQSLGCAPKSGNMAGQTAGRRFEEITKDFLEEAFALLYHLRPGKWYYSTRAPISSFDQYEHLAYLEETIEKSSELASALGTDYIIRPDIVIGRFPVSDGEINREQQILSQTDPVAKLTPFREANSKRPLPSLHASVSCKWTIRSDRGQTPRTEVLNLIRNRKGHVPHIVAVTAEPTPLRIAALALGTGDLDCVYHFALPEMKEAVLETGNEDHREMLDMLIEGRRLRDISDLPFDLAT
jgi:hypothetical protein